MEQRGKRAMELGAKLAQHTQQLLVLQSLPSACSRSATHSERAFLTGEEETRIKDRNLAIYFAVCALLCLSHRKSFCSNSPTSYHHIVLILKVRIVSMLVCMLQRVSAGGKEIGKWIFQWWERVSISY